METLPGPPLLAPPRAAPQLGVLLYPRLTLARCYPPGR